MLKKINILKTLYTLQDKAYRDFNSKLIPNISSDSFIGVRTPQLRKLAKDLIKSNQYKDFISHLPHKYFEENQLHAFILSLLPDFDFVICETDRFLQYVDNWATCDQLSPIIFKKNLNSVLIYIYKWINSKHTYMVRFAIKVLMQYWLDNNFDEKYADLIANIKSDEYYVNMMRAWYFATAAAKQFKRILPYFHKGNIDEWTRSRAIQKSLESLRVSEENKKVLRSLR
jgi:3-methyladenine DNA glycosylase AlkD